MEPEMSILSKMLKEAKLYTQSEDYRKLLEFTVKLRRFAPFNAMLLQIQKPGLSYAATVKEWSWRFNRRPKYGARPLLIMRPFSPVDFVFDIQDTEGDPVPDSVFAFRAEGNVDRLQMKQYEALMLKKAHIRCVYIDAGEYRAGVARVERKGDKKDEVKNYQVFINSNHSPNVQLTNLIHELAHIYLGHFGSDKRLHVPERRQIYDKLQEIEAESVSYVVCARQGVESKAEGYLASHMDKDTSVKDIDVYQVMRTAGQIEQLLNLAKSC